MNDSILYKNFHEYLSYRDGKLFWTKQKSKYGQKTLGKEFGCHDKDGYIVGKFNGKQYRVHRVIWFMHYREWPKQIDHINGIKDDNRIENLRECDFSSNGANITKRRSFAKYDLPKGVTIANGRYRCQIYKNGKRVYCKHFSDPFVAHLNYIKNHKKIFKEFSPY